MSQQEKALCLPKSKDVLNWKIKTFARSPREMMITQSIFIAIYMTGSTLYMWGGWIMFSDSLYSLVGTILALAGILAYYLCLLIRQKTIYNYTITTHHALVEYYLHYPDFASSFFKGIAIAVIMLFVFVAILTGSLLFLIGPVAMAFIAAIKLLNWENPIHHEQSLPWGEYNFVTVDRKRLMIITHRTDITLGFEARFQQEVLFNKYLNFLHTVLPPTAEFTEKAWKW
ncbi:permease [Pseudomonas syringae]|uniref:Permease n=1 Tax=Pseudomonas syringae pv. syringae TaxID=321 RepID=A0AB35JJT4_PSESY|nr:permease [Pseudomonas syringae]MBI6752257.1 permease [Pseudomonas syringae]MBI6771584.1 permease [Pseudomonas syringae]MBI6778365.1 permease [Pseudomonas syringae]MBI6791588.1 permease [Pseudomonas syringae]MBI6803333.1 permease [Pseudomonas syringae]